MEVHVTSKQMVKPSCSNLNLLKPFKLSLLDQLSPTNYVPCVLFYAKPGDSPIDGSQFSDRLKQSLSKALTQFYPLAGRTKNNLFVTDYEEGVPYVEARVKGCLSDFIEQSEVLEALNQLLPCRPFCYLQDSAVPQLAIQVNIFDCGGIALAMCFFHKIIDASTIAAFLRTWAAFSLGSNGEIPDFDLSWPSSQLFPPIESNSMSSNTELKGLLFNEGRRRTRSFVFDANAIATLKSKARSKGLEHPSRVVSLNAFIWKHAMQAYTSVSGTRKPAILCQPVSIRQKMKPRLPDYSIGNLFLLPITTYNSIGKDTELTELAYLVREAAKSVANDSHDLLQVSKTITEQQSQIAEMVSKGNAEFYTSVSWLNHLDGKDDFGWGEPTLFSIPGVDSHNREYCNCFILKRARQHDAIEAWVTLSDEAMGFLEDDHEFLAFASPNPYFGKIKI
ncbi:hypothetical protein like AT3G26040 [Hibiscus trionum]|uniref:Transferase n=1 Tax=Hibiscus trionum TaxID=183268 RepID=A0A9W7J576_HIBTR|nr:hypothetical protein like AT3G26040 [Hibiscus trionum]GMJ08812.1 hypothetical protein like AT3G26040 [Hibiscus trionum]GMJ08813.1 hypothetical protein like AT3G26040 [Hibiscus trionum]